MGFKYRAFISFLITLELSSGTKGVTINVHNIKAKDLVMETETKPESDPLPIRNSFRSEFTDFETQQMEGIYPDYMEIPADDPRFGNYLIQAVREPIPTTPKPPPSHPSQLSQYNLYPDFGIVVKNVTTTTEAPLDESDEEDEEELDDVPRLEGVYTAMEREKHERERLMNDLDEGSDEDYQDDEEYEYEDE